MADMVCNSGHASTTIASTDKNVNCHEGSKIPLGLHNRRASAAPPTALREEARRKTIVPPATTVNMNAARTTEASAPTPSAYSHTMAADDSDGNNRLRETLRKSRKTVLPRKLIWRPLITRTWKVPPTRKRCAVAYERL